MNLESTYLSRNDYLKAAECQLSLIKISIKKGNKKAALHKLNELLAVLEKARSNDLDQCRFMDKALVSHYFLNQTPETDSGAKLLVNKQLSILASYSEENDKLIAIEAQEGGRNSTRFLRWNATVCYESIAALNLCKQDKELNRLLNYLRQLASKSPSINDTFVQMSGLNSVEVFPASSRKLIEQLLLSARKNRTS